MRALLALLLLCSCVHAPSQRVEAPSTVLRPTAAGSDQKIEGSTHVLTFGMPE